MTKPLRLPLLPLLLAGSLATYAAPASSSTELTLKTERFGMPALSLGPYVYVPGGHSNLRPQNDIEQIDLANKAVTILPARVQPRYFHMGAVYNDRLILLGGTALQPGRVEEFNPATGEIRDLPPMPEPLTRAGAVVHGDRLFVVGGCETVGRRVASVHIFDFKMETWSRGADMPVAREGCIALKDGRIYAPAGYDGEKAIAAFQVYDIARDQWTRRPDLPVKMSAHSAVVCGNTLYTFGDYERMDRVAACDLESDEWSLVDVPYLSSRHNAAVVHGDQVLVIGGNLSPKAPFLNDIQVFSADDLAKAPRRPWTGESEAAKPQKPRALPPVPAIAQPAAAPASAPQEPIGPRARPELTSFSLTGKPAPDIELPLLDGETFRLSDHTGRVVVIDFWATWCAPCEKALPHMAELAKSFDGRDVVFLGVSRDRAADEDKVKAAVEQHQLPYPVGVDLQGLAMDYSVGAIPCVVLIDRDGKVQGRQLGFWEEGPALLRQGIEILLAGEPLTLAAPPKEREPVAAPDRSAALRLTARGFHTEPDARYFKKIWDFEVETPSSTRFSGQRLDVTIPPRTYAAVAGQELKVIQLPGGATSSVFRLPAAAVETNEMDNLPQVLFLETSDGGLAVVGQTYYEVRKTSETGRSFSPRSCRLAAFTADGTERWSVELDRMSMIQQMAVLPAGDDRSMLLVATHGGLVIFNEKGERTMEQSIGYQDHWTIFQSGPGEPLRAIVRGGGTVAAYEWSLPLAP